MNYLSMFSSSYDFQTLCELRNSGTSDLEGPLVAAILGHLTQLDPPVAHHIDIHDVTSSVAKAGEAVAYHCLITFLKRHPHSSDIWPIYNVLTVVDTQGLLTCI